MSGRFKTGGLRYMRFFFIDLENVRSNGLEGVLSLDAEDQVFIFYSENANNLTIPTLENINNSKATVKFINTNFVGSNAMDFQIVSLLGAMIERNKQGFFSIISHDNGFKSALTFCERYFTDYPISVGKFDNIISAIAYDLKHPVKGSSNGNAPIRKKKKDSAAAEKQKQHDDKAVITGRRDVHEEVRDAQKQPKQQKQQEQKKQEQKQPAEVTVQEENGKQAAAPAEKKEGRSRRRRRASQQAAGDDAVKKQNGAEPVSAGPDMQYIYDYLKDMLSVKTIDVYASKIHEALLVANSKEELHKFFKSKCGEDEGEALFKLLHGDFENMKRKARK